MGEVEPSRTIGAEQFLDILSKSVSEALNEIENNENESIQVILNFKGTVRGDLKVPFDNPNINLEHKKLTIFIENVNFSDNVTIESSVNLPLSFAFKNCNFKKDANVRLYNDCSVVFYIAEIDNLCISGCGNNSFVAINDSIIKYSDIMLSDVPFKALFSATTFGEKITSATSIGTFELRGLSSSTLLEFKNCNFICVPNFSGSTLNHQTIFLDCKFKDLSAKSIACYRYLRSEMQRLNNHREADMFSSYEMEAYHKNNLSKNELTSSEKLEKFFSCLYSLFSNYGRDMTRPLIWIFATFLVFWLFLSFWFVDLTNEALQNPSSLAHYFIENGNLPSRRFAAFIQSVWNTLGPIGLFKTLCTIEITSPFAPVLIFIQKLISSIIWFLWLLQVRRRFKLS